MNCKPGDMAVVVGSKSLGGQLNGSFVRCISLVPGEDYWNVEALSPALIDLFRKHGVMQIYDSKLRPIRDPGDDARDETLDWLPVPHKEVA